MKILFVNTLLSNIHRNLKELISDNVSSILTYHTNNYKRNYAFALCIDVSNDFKLCYELRNSFYSILFIYFFYLIYYIFYII